MKIQLEEVVMYVVHDVCRRCLAAIVSNLLIGCVTFPYSNETWQPLEYPIRKRRVDEITVMQIW